MSNNKVKIFNNSNVDGFDADISISVNQIRITFRENASQQTIYWNIKDIDRVDIFSDSNIIITRKGRPTHSLVLNSIEFLNELKFHNRNLPFLIKNHNKKASGVVATVFIIAFLVIGLLIGAYFYLLPPLAEKLAMKIPADIEAKLGKSVYISTISSYKIDSAQTRLSQQFFDSLNLEGAKGVKITVIKSKDVNAFALPGGYIVVYDSILCHINRPEEYAALLAHEYAHVKFRHSLKGMARQLSGNLFFALILGDTDGSIATLASNADQLKGMQYSRELEKKADEEGIKMMANSGINPNGALGLFKALEKVSGSANGSEFLSTHPLFKTRMQYIEKLIPTINVKKRDVKNINDNFERIKK